MKRAAAFILIFFCYLLFSRGVYAQDFSSIDSDLSDLENLIQDTITSMEEQQKLLEDLRTNLNESGTLIAGYESIIQEQETLLKDLQARLNEMSEIYRMQSSLSARYAKSSRFWRTFTIIAIPVTAIVSGVIVWSAMR
ncbi:MAG: hypothetical protein LBQ89_06675 [Treponema sp.]|nr:hypothetical protein [Treponema sp.]